MEKPDFNKFKASDIINYVSYVGNIATGNVVTGLGSLLTKLSHNSDLAPEGSKKTNVVRNLSMIAAGLDIALQAAGVFEFSGWRTFFDGVSIYATSNDTTRYFTQPNVYKDNPWLTSDK